MSKLTENKQKIAKLIVKDIIKHPLIKENPVSNDIVALYYLLTEDDKFLEANERNYQYYLDLFDLGGGK